MMMDVNNRPTMLSLPAAARTLLLAIMAAAKLLLFDGACSPFGPASAISGSQMDGWLPLAAPTTAAALPSIGSAEGAAY